MLRMSFDLYAGDSNQALGISNKPLRQLNEEVGLAWSTLDNANAQLRVALQTVDHSNVVRDAHPRPCSLGERTLLDLTNPDQGKLRPNAQGPLFNRTYLRETAWNQKLVGFNSIMIHAASTTIRCWTACCHFVCCIKNLPAGRC